MDIKLHIVTLFVPSYDEAIRYYTQVLGFTLIEDILISPSRRWVKVAPDLQSPMQILLHVPNKEEEKGLVGNQAGSRPLLILSTQDLSTVVNTFQLRGVNFTKPITEEVYGRRAQFKDAFGHLWEIVQYTLFS